MIMKYDHITIEKKWQKEWENSGLFLADNVKTEKNTTYWKCFLTRLVEYIWGT